MFSEGFLLLVGNINLVTGRGPRGSWVANFSEKNLFRNHPLSGKSSQTLRWLCPLHIYVNQFNYNVCVCFLTPCKTKEMRNFGSQPMGRKKRLFREYLWIRSWSDIYGGKSYLCLCLVTKGNAQLYVEMWWRHSFPNYKFSSKALNWKRHSVFFSIYTALVLCLQARLSSS